MYLIYLLYDAFAFQIKMTHEVLTFFNILLIHQKRTDIDVK